MARPQIAVIGIPGLPGALRDIGVSTVTDSTDGRAVKEAIRATGEPPGPVLVIAPTMTAQGTAVAESLASEGWKVIAVGAMQADKAFVQVDLPVTVGALLAAARRPEQGTVEESAIITAALEVERPWLAPPPPPEPEEPAWDDDPDPQIAWDDDPQPPKRAEPAMPDWDAPAPVQEDRPAPPPPPAPWSAPRPRTPEAEVPPPPAPPIFRDAPPRGPSVRPASIPLDDDHPPARPQRDRPAPRPPREYDDLADLDLIESVAKIAPVAAGGRAPVVLLGSPKGGVAKSSLAAVTAKMAQELGRFDPTGAANKVVLIDGSWDQCSQMVILGADDETPTIFDYQVSNTGDPRKAIVSPTRLAQHRPAAAKPLGFGAVFSPREGTSHDVKPATFAEVLNAAREVAHLVVVDTQIFGDAESDLWEQVWLRVLPGPGAWLLMVMDDSKECRKLVPQRFRKLRKFGVGRDRLGFVLSRINPSLGQAELQPLIDKYEAEYADCAGIIHQSDRIFARFEQRDLPWDEPELRAVLGGFLYRVTGQRQFLAPAEEAAPAKRKGLLARLTGAVRG